MDIEHEIERLYRGEKTFAISPSWHYDGPNREFWSLSAPLSINYVTEEGLYFEGNCLVALRDQNLSLCLVYKPAIGISGCISRLDWKPLNSHRNNGGGDGQWKWKEISGTHHHPFEINRRLGWQRMARDNLPHAVPVEEPLNAFRELLTYVGQIWNISISRKFPSLSGIQDWYNMNYVAGSNAALYAIAEKVSRELSCARETNAGVFVTTPLCYASGTAVVVHIDGTKDRFFVSDLGVGFQESMMFNASTSYIKVAKNIIKNTGVSFDSRSFFVAEASVDELVGVVGAVANISQRAVIETSIIFEARKADRDRATLISRLEGAFGVTRVEKDFEIRGASSVEWEVTARISIGNVVALFDHAKPHKNSVTATVAKFHDIARLSCAPRRIVTIADRNGMGGFLGLLSQAANVISLSETPDEVLRKMVA